MQNFHKMHAEKAFLILTIESEQFRTVLYMHESLEFKVWCFGLPMTSSTPKTKLWESHVSNILTLETKAHSVITLTPCDDWYGHLGYGSLAMSVRITLAWEDLCCPWAGPFLGRGSWTVQNGGRKLSTSLSLSVLDCAGDVPAAPFTCLNSELGEILSPLSCVEPEYFIIATRKQRKMPCTTFVLSYKDSMLSLWLTDSKQPFPSHFDLGNLHHLLKSCTPFSLCLNVSLQSYCSRCWYVFLWEQCHSHWILY